MQCKMVSSVPANNRCPLDARSVPSMNDNQNVSDIVNCPLGQGAKLNVKVAGLE